MSKSYFTGWIAGRGRVRATSFETGYMEWRAYRYAHGYGSLVRFSATFLQSFIRRSSINHPFFDSTVATDCIGGRPVPSLHVTLGSNRSRNSGPYDRAGLSRAVGGLPTARI